MTMLESIREDLSELRFLLTPLLLFASGIAMCLYGCYLFLSW